MSGQVFTTQGALDTRYDLANEFEDEMRDQLTMRLMKIVGDNVEMGKTYLFRVIEIPDDQLMRGIKRITFKAYLREKETE